MDREEIKSYLPHREPMLLIDSVVTEVVTDATGNEVNYAVGTYHVRGDEYFLQGHFPGNPVLPGVCILQIFKELVETDLAFEQPIMYDEIKHCKFHLPIAMNKPFKAKVSLSLKQDGNFWNLSASLKNDAAIFTTLKAVLTTIKQDIHD